MDNHVKLLGPVIGAVLAMSFATSTGAFDNVATEVGFKHYAEPPDHNMPLIPSSLKMPMNCLVNIGYVLVGLYWIARSSKGKTGKGPQRELFFLYSWMTVVYGVVQFLRLLLQSHRLAVMDQWCTTPFFSFIALWAKSLVGKDRLTVERVAVVTTLSCAAYLMSLVHVLGFEMQLVLHIVVAVYYGVRLQLARGNGETLSVLFKTMFCCAGFVLLKVLDHTLGTLPFFQRFSGHFWSKVCDFMQIHYGLLLLEKFSVASLKGTE